MQPLKYSKTQKPCQQLFLVILMSQVLVSCGTDTDDNKASQTQKHINAQTATANDRDGDGVENNIDAEPDNQYIAGYVEITSYDKDGNLITGKPENGKTLKEAFAGYKKIGFNKSGNTTYIDSSEGIKIIHYKADTKIYEEQRYGGVNKNKVLFKKTFTENGDLLNFVHQIDNKLQRQETYQYNSKGDLLKVIKDTNGDGKTDFERVYLIDENGGYKKFDADNNLKGSKKISYDADNNKIEEVRDADLKGNWVKKTTYNPQGKKIAYEEVNSHDYVNETTKKQQTFSQGEKFRYNENGKETYYEKFVNNKATETKKTDYDKQGNEINLQWDTNGDGVFEYDANGNMTFKAKDYDGDGKWDNNLSKTYNSQGRAVLIELNKDANGKPRQTRKYQYHNNGKIALFEQDDHADGKPEISKTYNNNGLVLEEYARYQDGSFSYRDKYMYIGTVSEKAKIVGFARAKVPEDLFHF